MNKRDRYTKENMPEHVAILYNRFMSKDFITKLIQYMVIDEDGDEINFDIHRFRMFKVKNNYKKNKKTIIGYSRVFFEILAWI
jgi:hypothetical protein